MRLELVRIVRADILSLGKRLYTPYSPENSRGAWILMRESPRKKQTCRRGWGRKVQQVFLACY